MGVFIGASTGTIITMPLASLLCDSQFLGGWPAAFYVFGKLNENVTMYLKVSRICRRLSTETN